MGSVSCRARVRVGSMRLRMALAITLAAMLCLALLLFAPASALAREFSVGPVDIDATIDTDGSLTVVEERSYVFDGSFNGIYWDVPCGSHEGRVVEAQLESVGVWQEGKLHDFAQADGGESGTYELEKRDDCLRLKLHWSAADETVRFQVGYRLSSLATRWADTGELYWKYVPADPESGGEWTNVTATVHVPVPAGEPVVPGDNVRAWAHGPIDGELRFEGNDVVFFSPGVGAAEFLEARVCFPGAWLADAPTAGADRLDAILAEEDTWARETNARRLRDRVATYGTLGFMFLSAIGSVVAAIMGKKWRRARGPKPTFTDTYYRDVPTDDHPAVLGKLYRDGRLEVDDLSATLMRLTDQGRVALDAVWVDKRDRHGHAKRDREWRLLLQGGAPKKTAGQQARLIDDRAYAFLRNVVADEHLHHIDPQLMGSHGEPYVVTSFFAETAERSPEAYEKGYNGWASAVNAAFDQRKYAQRGESSLFPGLLGLADFALAVILGIAGMLMGLPNGVLAVAIVVLFGAGIYVLMSDEDEPTLIYSQEAVDVKAQLEALRRWLLDFTRLEEAIPADVVLWNRLLVMATVLGVADKVVEQLKVRLPEVAADSRLIWVDDGSELDRPFRSLGESAGEAKAAAAAKLYHEVSNYSSARSHDSSSSGSGGGFSSGGGGGFSGGGRGGAF